MNSLKHILNKHRLEAFVVLFLIVVAVLYFSNFTQAQSPYIAPADLNPTCGPSDPNCFVYPIAIGSTVGNATLGSIPFIGAGGLLDQDNANLFWDYVNKRLSIGDQTNEITIESNSSTVDVGMPFSVHEEGSNFGIFGFFGYSDSTSESVAFGGAKARGTKSLPTALTTSGDKLLSITALGYKGDGIYQKASRILFNIDGTPNEDPDTSDMPGRITFLTTPDGSDGLVERMRIDSAGNVGIGTTSPVSPLEVAGVIHSTSGGIKFPDNTTQTTAATGGASYDVYTAILNQTGTNAPVATVLENDIGAIVWARTGIGQYTGTLSSAFTINKTILFIGPLVAVSGTFAVPTWFKRNDNDIVSLLTQDVDVAGADAQLNDGLLQNTSIEIRVYP